MAWVARYLGKTEDAKRCTEQLEKSQDVKSGVNKCYWIHEDPFVCPTDPRALVCRWHLHNAMTQQRYNDTSVTRGLAREKAGR